MLAISSNDRVFVLTGSGVSAESGIPTFRIALSHGMRRCLICDRVFTVRGAAQHSVEICCASPQVSPSRPTPLK